MAIMSPLFDITENTETKVNPATSYLPGKIIPYLLTLLHIYTTILKQEMFVKHLCPHPWETSTKKINVNSKKLEFF